MGRSFFACAAGCIFAAAFVVPTFATDRTYTATTAGGPTTWNTAGNWNPSGIPGSTDQARITNVLTTAGVRTVTGAVAGTTIDFLQVGNTSGGLGTNLVRFQNTFTSSFGFINSANGIIEVTNTTARFGTTSGVTFRNEGQLIVRDAGLVILNAAGGKALTNGGTINFTVGTGIGDAEVNYGQVTSFTNALGGVVVKNGTGTGAFTGEFGGANRAFINEGSVFVNAGVMKFDPRDAFSAGGFSNTVNGNIFIGNNATAMVARTANAWENAAMVKVSNVGSISLFGGAYLAQNQNDSTIKISATNLNTGVISGSGTLGWRFVNDTGTLLATGGVLRVLYPIVGAAGTFAAGGAAGSGTLNLEGGNLNAGGTLTGNVIATNSSAIVFSGDSDWTISSAAQYGFAAAMVAERGSLISSNATGGSETLFLNNAGFRNNQGTLAVVNGNGINYGQIGDHMTNNFVLTGVGTFTGTFGAANNGLLNLGTISTVAGGLLAIDPRDSLTFGGLQNGRTATATGTIVIANGATLSIRRTDAAWFTYGTSPTNLGTINMQGGSLIASNADSVAGGSPTDGGKIINAAGGSMIVTGANNITNFRVLQNNGLINLGATSSVTVALNSGGTFDNRGGVVELRGTGSLQGGGGSTLSMNGNYISDANSAITNTAGGGFLLFTGVTAVTNNGTISFLSGTGGTGGSGAGGNTNAMILVGSSAANFFRNSGTLMFGTRSNAANRIFVISNQFANAGTFVVTNGAVLGAGGQPLVTIVGSTRATGGASTNLLAGTIRLVNEATLGAASSSLQTSFLNGDFINLGTITYSTVSNTTAVWLQSEANSVLSNAAGGRIIMESGMIGAGDLSLRADRIVNMGVIALSNSVGASGTAGLNIQNSANAGTVILTNSGDILFGGGILNATGIVNRASGVISGNGTFSGPAIRLVENSGIIRASGGTLFLAMVTNVNQAIVNLGAILRVQDMNNSGMVTVDSAGLVVRGAFINSGSTVFMNSMGTFDGTVVNSGAWISDPSTNIFANTYTLTSSGSISMGAGDVYIFTNGAATVGSFINLSTQSNTTSMLPGKFLFDSTLTLTQQFATAGDNIGSLDTDGGFNTVTVTTLDPNILAQYSNNFALGSLQLSGISTTEVFDSNIIGGRGHNGLEAALFLTNLTLDAGSFLIISNNVQVYFITSNGFSSAQINLMGNGGLHQLVVEAVAAVPEPNVILLWVCGIATVYGARHRNRKTR